MYICCNRFILKIFLPLNDIYQEINWNRINFIDRFEEIYGIKIKTENIFAKYMQGYIASKKEKAK